MKLAFAVRRAIVKICIIDRKMYCFVFKNSMRNINSIIFIDYISYRIRNFSLSFRYSIIVNWKP